MGNSTARLFTSEDSWTGGYYGASLFYPPHTSAVEPLRALWSFTQLEGPFSSQFEEPSAQPVVDIEGDDRLNGVLRLPGDVRVACASFVTLGDGATEIDFSVSIGSLASAWPEVGGFPFVADDDTATWEPRLLSILVELARHVHERRPFVRGLIGFEGIGFTDELRRPGAVPDERGVGFLEVRGAEIHWFPPTVRGGQ